MAWDINRVVLIGRLTRDVELKYTPSSTPVANFSLAVGGKPGQDGKDNVSFFNITVWGKSAESCSQYLSKGKQCSIDGRIEQRRWKDKDGGNRSAVEVVAERVEFLGSGEGGGNNSKPSGGNQNNNYNGNQNDNYTNEDGDEVEPW